MKPEPRVGCGAAIVEDGRLLLIQRRAAPEAMHWGLPGGKVDWLEPVETAIAREILEELGVAIRAMRFLCLTDQIDPIAGTHWLAPVYWVEAYDGTPQVMEADKHAALGWFRLDALPEPLTLGTKLALPSLNPPYP